MRKLLSISILKLTIFQKLLIGIIAMGILNAYIAYVGIESVNKLENTSGLILNESNKYNNLQSLKLSFNELLMPANDYLIHGNEVEILNYKKLDSIVRKKLMLANASESNHFNEHFLEEIEAILHRVELLSKKIFKLKNPIGNSQGAIMMEDMDAIVVNAEKKIDILLASSSLLMNKQIKTTKLINLRSSRIIIIVIVIIMISLLVGGFYYVKEITKPIEKLTEVAKNVTLGNLESKSNESYQTHDEIDKFANLFNNMMGILSEKTISKEYLISIIQKIDESLIITTIEGEIIIVNKATLELLEYKEGDLVGKSMDQILLGENKNTRTTLEEEAPQNIFNVYFSKTNKAIPVSFSKTFIYDNNNKKTGILYLAYNKSENFDKNHKSIDETFENKRKLKIQDKTPLTNRELEVIKLIVKEYSSQEIADKLFISIRTVETHRKNIMSKLHVKSIIGLVHYAIQNNLI